MVLKQNKSLLEPYSHLFLDFDIFDFKFENGWIELVFDLCRTLDIYFSLYPDSDFLNFKIISLQEKFGCLEIESINSNETIDIILRATSLLSCKTCEKCGKLGQLYCSTKWLHWCDKKILCKTHAVQFRYYSIKA